LAYRFKRKESVPESVRRIVIEQTRNAAEQLGGGNPDIHEGVHAARKSLKKTRSVLRLVRDEIGEQTYRRENRRLRETAHRLAGARDAEAMLETYDKLAERFADQQGCPTFVGLRGWLLEHRERIVSAQQDLEQRAKALAEDLLQLPERVEDWHLSRTGFSALADGYVRCYRRGRKAFHRALAKPGDRRYHDWRKRVKDYWYHSRLLRRSWPSILEPRTAELKRLSDLLGDDHDLAVLQALLVSEQAYLGDTTPFFTGLIRQRQEELRKSAAPLGNRLYASAPDCAVDQMAELWEAWKQG
jgi:CHAD domain-containing protein